MVTVAQPQPIDSLRLVVDAETRPQGAQVRADGAGADAEKGSGTGVRACHHIGAQYV